MKFSHRPTQTHTDICPSDPLGQIQPKGLTIFSWPSPAGKKNLSVSVCPCVSVANKKQFSLHSLCLERVRRVGGER